MLWHSQLVNNESSPAVNYRGLAKQLSNQVSKWLVSNKEQGDGPTHWPPHSTDITPIDFLSIWGYVKERVYAKQVPDIEELSKVRGVIGRKHNCCNAQKHMA